MGRYPFVCAYRRYLRKARGRLSEGTIAERERKLHFLAKAVQHLHEAGMISSSNPSLLTEDDVLEIFLSLKGRGMRCSTLRKYMQLLKAVCRECGNRVVEDMLADGKIKPGNELQEPYSLDQEDLGQMLLACEKVGGWKGDVMSLRHRHAHLPSPPPWRAAPSIAQGFGPAQGDLPDRLPEGPGPLRRDDATTLAGRAEAVRGRLPEGEGGDAAVQRSGRGQGYRLDTGHIPQRRRRLHPAGLRPSQGRHQP